MTAKRGGLGRGLQSLLSAVETQPLDSPSLAGVLHVSITALKPNPFQPRQDFNETALEELTQSILKHGIIQPIVVRQRPEGYEIIAGERRWRAASRAGLQEVPVILRSISDEEASAFALIENIQRQDLNPIEEAKAIERLIQEYRLTHQEVSETLGKSRSTTTNLLRLLQLAPKVQEFLKKGDIEMGHAKVLLGLEKENQVHWAHKIREENLSVRALEKILQTNVKPVKRKDANENQMVQKIARELSDKLVKPVLIKHKANGEGSLTIRYHSLDDLLDLVKKL